MSVVETNVVELGHVVTLVLPRSVHRQIAAAAQANGLDVEQEALNRLARSFHRRRASDAMDEFLAAACKPEIEPD